MSERIVCKPTPWFLLRAAAMILMFGIFAGMFYKDGRWGYREENLSYFVWKAFERAASEFGQRKDTMNPAEWRDYASKQEVEMPEDHDTLPAGTSVPMPWPGMLGDYETMEAGFANPRRDLFDRYRDQAGLEKDAPDEPFSKRKILDQWVVFWICLVLFLGALFVLLRTISRKVVLEGARFHPAGGKAFDIKEIVRLDLRNWQAKGLAFAWVDGGSGIERKVRIDGLSYGGFKPEDGEPAEKMMQALKSQFSGELIEYEPPSTPESAAESSDG